MEEQSFILSPDEIVALTGHKFKTAQAQALRTMGISFLTRPDGSVVVLRSHIESVMGGVEPKPRTKKVEPNWAAIDPNYRRTPEEQAHELLRLAQLEREREHAKKQKERERKALAQQKYKERMAQRKIERQAAADRVRQRKEAMRAENDRLKAEKASLDS